MGSQPLVLHTLIKFNYNLRNLIESLLTIMAPARHHRNNVNIKVDDTPNGRSPRKD